MEYFKYAFAEKSGRILSICYNQEWENIFWEYLADKGYQLRPGTEWHFNRHIDEVGRLCECYLLDESLKEFDVGEF